MILKQWYLQQHHVIVQLQYYQYPSACQQESLRQQWDDKCKALRIPWFAVDVLLQPVNRHDIPARDRIRRDRLIICCAVLQTAHLAEGHAALQVLVQP